MSKRAAAALQVLNNKWHGCTKCVLHTMRSGSEIFFGHGPAAPRFFIVGGTPTPADEQFGALFAGEEGALLFELLEKANISQKHCYFTYSVACRPKVYIPATDTEEERVEGRAPLKPETTACRPRLYEQLYQTDPRIVITLGEVATKSMVRGRLPKFINAVGKQYTCSLPSATREDREDGKTEGRARYLDLVYPVMAIPDMISILNNPSTAEHGPYHVALKTLKRAQTYVDFTISGEMNTKGSA